LGGVEVKIQLTQPAGAGTGAELGNIVVIQTSKLELNRGDKLVT
jgi:hypothetical protein